MKHRVLCSLFALPVLFVLTVSAQRPDTAPATMSSGKPPDTVFIEELTWAEVRDLVAAARSLKAHGATDILFIGDSGGNQAGMTAVAGKPGR